MKKSLKIWSGLGSVVLGSPFALGFCSINNNQKIKSNSVLNQSNVTFTANTSPLTAEVVWNCSPQKSTFATRHPRTGNDEWNHRFGDSGDVGNFKNFHFILYAQNDDAIRNIVNGRFENQPLGIKYLPNYQPSFDYGTSTYSGAHLPGIWDDGHWFTREHSYDKIDSGTGLIYRYGNKEWDKNINSGIRIGTVYSPATNPSWSNNRCAWYSGIFVNPKIIKGNNDNEIQTVNCSLQDGKISFLSSSEQILFSRSVTKQNDNWNPAWKNCFEKDQQWMINYIQLKEGHYDYVVEWDMLNGIKKINNHETVTKLDDKGNTIKLLGSVKMDCNWKFNWNNKDAISGYLNNAEVEGIANTVLWPMNSASYSDVEPEARIKGYIVDINQQTPAQQTKIIKKYSWEIKEINGQDISFIEVSNPEEIIESKSLGCKIKTAKDKTTPILKDGQLYQEYNINVKCHITAYDDSTQDVDCGTFSLYVYDTNKLYVNANQVFANENVSGLAFGWKESADNKVALGYANFDKEISNLQFKTDFTVNFLGTEYTNCNVVKICNGAFNSCNNILKSIVIPKTVTEIEAGAFNNLQNVDCIEFESEIPPKFGVDEETNLFWVNNMSQKFHIIVPGPEAVTAYRDADGINLHNSLIMDGLVTPKTVDIDADNFIEGKTDSDGFYQLEAITHPDGMVKTGTWFVSCMDLGDKISCDSNTGKLSWQAGISPGQYRLDIIYLWNKNAIITATKTITLQINDISPIVNDSNLALGLGLGLGIGVPGVMAAVGVPIIVNKKKQKTEEELSELK